jgi:hypothetical protein
VRALELEEARHGGGERQPFRIGGVDAARERVRDAGERLLAQAAPHERGQALVVVPRPPRQDQVEGHAELAAEGEQRRGRHRPRRRRRHQQEPLGQRVQAAVVHDVGAPVVLARADEPVRDPDALAERQAPRLVGDHGVGAALNDEPAAALRPDAAAESVGRLQQDDVEGGAGLRLLDEPVRGRESGDSTADHDDATAAHAARPRTSSASMRRKSG